MQRVSEVEAAPIQWQRPFDGRRVLYRNIRKTEQVFDQIANTGRRKLIAVTHDPFELQDNCTRHEQTVSRKHEAQSDRRLRRIVFRVITRKYVCIQCFHRDSRTPFLTASSICSRLTVGPR